MYNLYYNFTHNENIIISLINQHTHTHSATYFSFSLFLSLTHIMYINTSSSI